MSGESDGDVSDSRRLQEENDVHGITSKSSARWRIPVAALVLSAASAVPALCEATHAVSLRRLAERLQACQGNGSCPRSLHELDGLRVIDGYVVDPADGDVVLVGRRGDKLPPLVVEDFAVALRNAWARYAERRGNTIIYSHPGCSIDPDPMVMRELNGIAARVMTGDGTVQKEWDRVCKKPQDVRVMGMPFHSHFAKVLVQADYDMKSQVDGSDPLQISGLESITQMTLAQIRRDVEADRPISIPLSSMNRFWFYPGKNAWEEGDGVVLIRESPVTLLSSQTFVNAKNQVVDAVERDPIAEKFAERFTQHFDEVADRRPIYRQLEGLFRFVALAKILEDKVRSTSAEATLGYYLDDYRVARTDVPTQLPGRSHVDGFEHRRAVTGGVEVMTLRLPSCGGVSIDIEAEAKNYRPDRGGKLRQLRDTVLGAKRASLGVGFNISGTPGTPATPTRRRRTEDNVFAVRKARDGFHLVTPGQTELYTLQDRERLVEDVAELTSAGRIYLDLEGFSADEAEVFKRDFRLGQDRAGVDATLVVVRDAGELLTRPVQLVETSEPRQITAGEYQGWWQSTVYVVQGAKEIALEIRARTLELLRFLIQKIRTLLQTGSLGPGRLIDRMLRETRRDFRGSYQEKDVELRIHEETGNCRMVEQPRARERVAT